MKSERVKFRKVLIFTVLFGTVIALAVGTASVATHYVNSGEPIQAAVNTASSGDTIIAKSGTYDENVNLTKRLILSGAETGSERPIEDAGRSRSLVTSNRAQEVQAVEASASFTVNDLTEVRSNNDSITSGIQLVQHIYGLFVYNTNDTSDTMLGNLEYALQGDNIVAVEDEEYADWNESYVKWVFPSDHVLVEDDWLWTEAETSIFETKYVPMSISRRMNKSIFDADGYQLAEFNVTFDEINFDCFDYFGDLLTENYSMVNASFLPDTFCTDAPLDSDNPFSEKNEHYIEFILDKSQLQANKTYNFSVVVQVDLKGDNPYPILYKPYFHIGIEFNSSCATGPIGKNVTMPNDMLPKHIHNASASTNVSNTWDIMTRNQLIAALNEVYEPINPKSEIHVHKEEWLSTYDTHIDHNRIYNFTTRWDANVWEVENLDNVTYTITTSKNFTYIDNWEMYPNGTENTFVLPPTVEGQNYTWFLPLKDRIGSEISFVLDSSQTVQDNPWADMDVSTTDENGYTRVNVTFTPIIPIDWINFRVGGDQIIDVSAYPPEFEIELTSTSSYVRFDSGDITQDHVYNFSVLWDNPKKVKLELYASFGWVEESPSNAITLPVAELGSVTVKADVPVIWEHTPTQPEYVQSITIEFEEEKPTHTDVGVTVDIELSNSTEMAPLLPPGTNLTNAIVIEVNVTDDTPGNSTDDAYTDITINVGELDAETCAVYKEGSGFLPEVDDVATLPTVKPPGEAKFSRDVTNDSVIVRLFVGDPLLGVIPPSIEGVFDTDKGTYPSIMGTHNGTITPSYNISVSKLYTYPCLGTGGHTESIELYENGTLIASGTWSGYKDDYHNITITPSVMLWEGREYRYVIKTGSYPQIIHEHEYENATGGTITCTQFTDVNGKTYTDWIPAIKLE